MVVNQAILKEVKLNLRLTTDVFDAQLSSYILAAEKDIGDRINRKLNSTFYDLHPEFKNLVIIMVQSLFRRDNKDKNNQDLSPIFDKLLESAILNLDLVQSDDSTPDLTPAEIRVLIEALKTRLDTDEANIKSNTTKSDKNVVGVQKNVNSITQNQENINKNVNSIKRNRELIDVNTKHYADWDEDLKKTNTQVTTNTSNISKNTNAIENLSKQGYDDTKVKDDIKANGEKITALETKHTTQDPIVNSFSKTGGTIAVDANFTATAGKEIRGKLYDLEISKSIKDFSDDIDSKIENNKDDIQKLTENVYTKSDVYNKIEINAKDDVLDKKINANSTKIGESANFVQYNYNYDQRFGFVNNTGYDISNTPIWTRDITQLIFPEGLQVLTKEFTIVQAKDAILDIKSIPTDPTNDDFWGYYNCVKIGGVWTHEIKYKKADSTNTNYAAGTYKPSPKLTGWLNIDMQKEIPVIYFELATDNTIQFVQNEWIQEYFAYPKNPDGWHINIFQKPILSNKPDTYWDEYIDYTNDIKPLPILTTKSIADEIKSGKYGSYDRVLVDSNQYYIEIKLLFNLISGDTTSNWTQEFDFNQMLSHVFKFTGGNLNYGFVNTKYNNTVLSNQLLYPFVNENIFREDIFKDRNVNGGAYTSNNFTTDKLEYQVYGLKWRVIDTISHKPAPQFYKVEK